MHDYKSPLEMFYRWEKETPLHTTRVVGTAPNFPNKKLKVFSGGVPI